MSDYKKIADLIYPNITKDVAYWENKYKPRDIGGAEVTRFAPSPTGYMHIGHFFGANLDYRISRTTPNGRFLFRLEDTDKKREIEGSDIVALKTLAYYGIVPDEGFTIERTDNGEYGPYRQSDRTEIYQTYAKYLISIGRAFPCFCEKPEGKKEVLEKREQQLQDDKQMVEKDPCRDLSYEEVKANIDAGKKFCIRLKSLGNEGDKVKVYDLVRGEREIGANCKDCVLIKDNGIPPYTFAHPVDDHLMHTTVVVRGEEWISTWPQHVEIFDALGFEMPKYIHTPVLCKIGDNGNKRKISKSKDPEADMRFYIQAGLPTSAVTEYLLNLMNSNFEDWRTANPEASINEFPFSVQKIGTSSPFFDIVKLEDVSKNIISKMTSEEVYAHTLDWATNYDYTFEKESKEKLGDGFDMPYVDPNIFGQYLRDNKDYVIATLSIDRYTAKPRKDIAKWSEIPQYYNYMFGLFNPQNISDYEYNFSKFTYAQAGQFLQDYLKVYDSNDEKDVWFNKIKEVANANGFCVDNKLYKSNPNAYIGNTADACSLIRLAITGKSNSPDLYSICKVLGNQKVAEKINKMIEILNK